VIELAPNNAAAHFYLASSQQALYRPGPARANDPENRQRLDTAIAEYKMTLEVATGDDPNDKTLTNNALSALAGIYADVPFRDYETAISYADQLVKQNPDDIKNLFAMANLYEKFGHIDLAEQTYSRAWELNPSDVKACGALAAFYNKPLWEAHSRFDDAIGVLERCAALAPDDPTGFYKVATFYWDKAYRDPTLDDKQKNAYADKGLAAVEKALALKADYIDAIVYKGLLLRVKAGVTHDRRLAFQLLEEAQGLQKLSLDLRRQQAEQGSTEATP
jgi:tetratricopeptide (TPR) repeat protein